MLFTSHDAGEHGLYSLNTHIPKFKVAQTTWIKLSKWKNFIMKDEVRWHITNIYICICPKTCWKSTLFSNRFLFVPGSIIIKEEWDTPIVWRTSFQINNENYFSLIGIICTLFGNFPRSSVGWRVVSSHKFLFKNKICCYDYFLLLKICGKTVG